MHSSNLHERCLTNPVPCIVNTTASSRPWAWFIVTIIVAFVVLFYRLGALPIQLWDEARLANSALEMAQSGLSLVTTYDGMPDHWNTKPPLLIWLMSISIRWLGPNEWGVRLPSVVAALATVGIVFTFCNVRLKRPSIGFVAILVLFLGNGYVQTHAARSGDYDATLALWTTGYLLSGYMYMHDRESKRRLWLLLCAIAIVLAFLTKTIQGLIFLPALLIYAVTQGRMFEMLRSPAVYMAVAMVLLICVGYYFAREQLDPGYFAAVRDNDLLGRYSSAIDGHSGGPLYYVLYFPLLFVSLLLAGYQFWRGQGERRQISVFLGVVSLFYLLVISLGAAKLTWYAVPLFPLSAIIIAIGLDGVLEWTMMYWSSFKAITKGMLVPLCLLAAIGVIAENIYLLQRKEASDLSDRRYLTDFFLRSSIVQSESPKRFVVIQQGFAPSPDQDSAGYYGPTSFYVKALRAAGHSIAIQSPSADISPDFDDAVMCGAEMRDAMTARVTLDPLVTDGECGIYRLMAR